MLKSLHRRGLVCLAVLVSLMLVPLNPAHGDPSLSRVYTETVTYDESNADPGRLHNAEIGFRQLQAFFDTVQFQPGVEYSFNQDVLHDAIPRNLGYVDTKSGYGDGINGAASLLNALIHRALFWDSDGNQKPVFEPVHASPIKNDKLFGVYAVMIYLDGSGAQSRDYVWRLNPAYSGPSPRITSYFDEEAVAASLTMTYADKAPAPYGDPGSVPLGKALASNLQAMIGDHRLGVSIIPVANPGDEIGVNENAQVPSASSWKSGGAVYFFENVSPDVWRSVPVRYWNLRNVQRVPAEYHDAWLKYHEILRWVYVMVVFSGNHEAGNVLAYVYRNTPHPPGSNPIRAFNNWCIQAAGMSPESGLYSWHFGDLMDPSYIDVRYANRFLVQNGEALFYTTTYSARDLALFFLHLATVGKERGYYDTLVELFSIRTEIVSKIEGQVQDYPQIQTATKDGYFSPESPLSFGHDVNNDAGLLIFPDGRRYAIAFTAFDAVDMENDVVRAVIRALVDDHPAAPKSSP
jgi:hypothetical protein